MKRLPPKPYVTVFLMALLVRALLFVTVMDHGERLLQPDSKIYLAIAESLRAEGAFQPGHGPVPAFLVRVPGYPLFLAALLWLAGGSILAVAVVQIVLDAVSCAMISWLGEALWKGAGAISGLLAAGNLGMIAYSHFLLSDSLFMLLFLAGMIAMCGFLQKPEWRAALAAGIALGVAAQVRSVVVYLPLVLVPFSVVFLRAKRREDWAICLGKSALMGVLFLLCLLPWALRNQMQFGRFALSAQAGEHLLQYVVPSVWQHSKGMPLAEGMRRVSEEYRARAAKEGLDAGEANPFSVSGLQVEMAVEHLREEPASALFTAWTVGAAKNLLAPAVVELSYLLDIPRPHFSYIEGKTAFEKAWNFVKSIPGAFGWLVMGGFFALILVRVIQVWGFFVLARHKRWEGFFFLMVVSYFLLVSGPVGYAKYRLPFEPILIILLAIGIKDLYGRWRGREVGGLRLEAGEVTGDEKRVDRDK